MYKKIAKNLNSKQKLYTIYTVIIIVSIIFLLNIFKERPEEDKSNNNRWRINVITAEQTTASPELELYGTIINPFTSRLKSTIETYVDQVNIREGVQVKKDDILVKLDQSDIELEVNRKKAIVDEMKAKLEIENAKYEFDKKSLAAEQKQLELTENNLKRQNTLRNKRLNAQINLDEVAIELQKVKITFYQRALEIDSFKYRIAELEAQLAQAEADYKKSALDLERTNIKAPFDGYISRLYVSPGTRIQPNETILEIFNIDTIEIKVQIPQSTMIDLQKSMNNENNIKAITYIFNKIYTLKFRNLTANQDISSGGTDAFFIFENSEATKEIRTIGKTVTVTLTLPSLNNVFMIPSISLHHNDRIYIVENNKLKSISVKILGTINKDNNEYLIISSDLLKNGDKILASVLPSAIDGLAVEVVD